MQIVRIIQIIGTCLMLGAFLMIGHSYNATMSAPAGGGQSARFVSKDGSSISRGNSGQPTLLDSAKLAWANFTGKEPKRSNGLKDLHTRTSLSNAPAPGSPEAVMRETEFWMNFTSKLGFTGP